MICLHCGYEKNTDGALYCNLCHVTFGKKETLPEKGEGKDKQKITTINDLPDELKAILLKEKEEVIRGQAAPIVESKKMMLIGLLLIGILLIVGGMVVLMPVLRTILAKN